MIKFKVEDEQNIIMYTSEADVSLSTSEAHPVRLRAEDNNMRLRADGGQPVRFEVSDLVDLGGIVPTGSISITGNGTYDVTTYAEASVDVQPDAPTEVLGITQNGDYDTYPNYAGVSVAVSTILKRGVIRPDAELIETYTHDSLVVEDDELTLPAYSTTAKTIEAAANLSPTIALDYDNYYYYVVERFLTTPVYNTDTPVKSRNEFGTGVALYEIVDIPPNSFVAANGKAYASRSAAAALGSVYRLLYWSSATAVAVYTSSSYGCAQVAAAPAISSGKLTIKAPSIQMRGSTSYLTSTVWPTITDIRRQFVIEVYRVPKNHLNVEGWGLDQETMAIIDCVNNNHGKLV